MTDVRILAPERFELGEGSRWVGDRVVMVDILSGRLFATPAPPGDAGLTELAKLPEPLGAVAPVQGEPGAWLAAAGTGFWMIDADGGREIASAEAVTDRPWRMNDGVADPSGRFWAGSMAYDQSPGNGALYRLDPDGSVRTVLRGLTIANGPAFTADGRVMYLADTPLGHIDRFDVDPATGALTGRQPFVRLDTAKGNPDGLTVDGEGYLWVAVHSGSAVHRYRPDGVLDRALDLPARQPTSVCLAGDRLVVTSAREGLDDPGEADGAVMVTDAGATGVPALSVRRG